MGVKRTLAALLALVLAVALAGCGDDTALDNDGQQAQLPESLIYGPEQQRETFVYGPEVRIAELVAADAAELSGGDEPRQVVLTPELRVAFFDLARLARWDFLRSWAFGDGERPRSENMNDYIYLIGAQACVWDNYYFEDWDYWDNLEEGVLSAAYVEDFIRIHFGYTVPHLDGWDKEMEFDGEKYLFYGDGWAYQPLYRLLELTVAKEDIDGETRVVYEAAMREYSYYPPNLDYEPDYDFLATEEGRRDVIGEARALLCGDGEPQLPEGYSEISSFGGSIHRVRFYLNELNQIRYLGKEHLEEL